METVSNVLANAMFTAFWDFTEAGAELMQENVVVINVIILCFIATSDYMSTFKENEVCKWSHTHNSILFM